MNALLRRMYSDDAGQDIIEYGLLVFLIVTATLVLSPVGSIGNLISSIFSAVAAQF